MRLSIRRNQRNGRPPALVRAVALAIFMLAPALAGSPAAAGGAHVYLFSGRLGVFFSEGIRQVADELSRDGVGTSVYDFSQWKSVADDIAADYRKGNVRTVILVGYSAGAQSVNDALAQLTRAGVPVRLAIGLDPHLPSTVSGRVGRYVNFYNRREGAKPATKGTNFRGSIQNVDLSSIEGIDHANVDDNRIVQTKILGTIRAAL